MLDKKLLSLVPGVKKSIFFSVALQLTALLANIGILSVLAKVFVQIYEKRSIEDSLIKLFVILLIVILIRAVCHIISSKLSYEAAKEVKQTLRPMIYNKIISFGSSYNEKVKTSEIVQIAVEGVEQLETYFALYLPQLFYACIAPIVLFLYISTIDITAAAVLFVCVPLIPISIAFVQKIAKKLLEKYWGKYMALGDTFLENLQGLTSLKIYKADEAYHQKMNREAEQFRKITMKVLSMQLNSIIIMDIVAFGGAAFGVLMAYLSYSGGNINMAQAFIIILLASEFFIPMRLLGSFFHIAMNGLAASKKIFKLLEINTDNVGSIKILTEGNISFSNVNFSYSEERQILEDISLEMEKGKLTAIVGESGSGKSTIASLVLGKFKNYSGEIKIFGNNLRDIDEQELFKRITYVGSNSYLFNNTVRENLLMGKPDASEEEMWQALRQTKLEDFLKTEQGLDTIVKEKAANLSGGQAQRLALARAILHDSPVYIFDEASSSIDVESENDIMKLIYDLAKVKTVILISHRLFNVKGADNIYVIKNGKIVESGKHEELLQKQYAYSSMWKAQEEMENYRMETEE